MNEKATLFDLIDRILTRNLGWVAAADAKIAPILAISTAMLGALAALIPHSNSWTIPSAILTAFATRLLLGAIVCLVAASFPRLKGPRGSLVYFGGIAAYAPDAYVSELLKGITDDLLKDYALQCHRNAEIARSKYANLRWAMILLYSSVSPFVIDVFLLYQLR